MNTKRTDRATDQKRADKDKNIKKNYFFSLYREKKFSDKLEIVERGGEEKNFRL